MIKEADIEALISLNNTRKYGVSSGYKPSHLIKDNYLTSGEHFYYNNCNLNPNSEVLGTIKFITPYVYPFTLHLGKIISFYEGGRKVGEAKVTKIFNRLLNEQYNWALEIISLIRHYEKNNDLLKNEKSFYELYNQIELLKNKYIKIDSNIWVNSIKTILNHEELLIKLIANILVLDNSDCRKIAKSNLKKIYRISSSDLVKKLIIKAFKVNHIFSPFIFLCK